MSRPVDSKFVRRLAEQADQLAQDRVERNARIKALEAERNEAVWLLRQVADKLEERGNEEPRAVATMIRLFLEANEDRAA